MPARPAVKPQEPACEPSRDLQHDARNLLQVIEGYLELIADKATDPEVRRYATHARSATERLIALSAEMPGRAPR